MQTDTTTRLLLAGILVCLIVLIVQGYGSGAGTVPGRYLMMATRAGTPILIRMDTATGRVWKQELRGGRGRWVEFQEPGEEEAPETAKAPPEPVEAPVPQEARIAIPREQAPAPATPAAGQPGASDGTDLENFAKAVRSDHVPVDIRVWAVTQLSRIHEPSSTEILLEALEDEEPRVVTAAIAAVGTRDHDGVAEALEATRTNLDPAVQAALEAVERGR
jgi:hypothetical protein